jgi:hypothetical protein
MNIAEIETIVLLLLADYIVQERSLKTINILLKQDLRDKYKKYIRLNRLILNESSINIEKNGIHFNTIWLNYLKLFNLDVTQKTENLSFHILLFLSVKEIRELTKYPLLDICTLISHTLEYFYLLPKHISKINYAYSLRNKFYRLKEYKNEVINLLKIEYELYNSNMKLTADQLTAILKFINTELD